jgi:hypothetical protein
MQHNQKSRLWQAIYPLLAPVLIGIYPTLFYYASNVEIVLISSLIRTTFLYFCISLAIYSFFLVFFKFNGIRAAVVACLYIFLFNVYGILYGFLLRIDVVRIEHYTLLPITLLITSFLCWFIYRLRDQVIRAIWKALVVVFLVLNVFNLIKTVPAEISKLKALDMQKGSTVTHQNSNNETYPDIYFMVFDELSGFQDMRDYWQNNKVDQFKSFLESKGFYVMENCRSESIDTLHELATRLNYQKYPMEPGASKTWFRDIANNQVMKYLRLRGYSTVVFEEISYAYPTAPAIESDFLFNVDNVSLSDVNSLFDEFGMLVADRSILIAFSQYYKTDNPLFQKHQNMITFTSEKISNLGEVPAPKFVFSHMLIPHFPFMFAENGQINDPINFYNWNYYEGHYNFSLTVIEKIITSILEKSDPNNPPVIILQSDHGARNQLTGNPGSAVLKDFPEEYKLDIMSALYLPRYDYSQLTNGLDPINIFPIVFNHVFKDTIPIR